MRWKLIPFASKFEASDMGAVRVRKSKRVLHQVKFSSRHPYFRVLLNGRKVFVHRCVLAAFVGESPLGVNHKNGRKSDNRLSNLEYATQRENVLHSYRIGTSAGVARAASRTWRNLHREKKIKYAKGEAHPMAKLTAAQVRRIRSSPISNTQAARKYGMNPYTIRDIRARKTWRHVT